MSWNFFSTVSGKLFAIDDPYQTSIKDGYRVNIRQKKDNKKIELIKNKLKNTSDVMWITKLVFFYKYKYLYKILNLFIIIDF